MTFVEPQDALTRALATGTNENEIITEFVKYAGPQSMLVKHDTSLHIVMLWFKMYYGVEPHACYLSYDPIDIINTKQLDHKKTQQFIEWTNIPYIDGDQNNISKQFLNFYKNHKTNTKKTIAQRILVLMDIRIKFGSFVMLEPNKTTWWCVSPQEYYRKKIFERIISEYEKETGKVIRIPEQVSTIENKGDNNDA